MTGAEGKFFHGFNGEKYDIKSMTGNSSSLAAWYSKTKNIAARAKFLDQLASEKSRLEGKVALVHGEDSLDPFIDGKKYDEALKSLKEEIAKSPISESRVTRLDKLLKKLGKPKLDPLGRAIQNATEPRLDLDRNDVGINTIIKNINNTLKDLKELHHELSAENNVDEFGDNYSRVLSDEKKRLEKRLEALQKSLVYLINYKHQNASIERHDSLNADLKEIGKYVNKHKPNQFSTAPLGKRKTNNDIKCEVFIHSAERREGHPDLYKDKKSRAGFAASPDQLRRAVDAYMRRCSGRSDNPDQPQQLRLTQGWFKKAYSHGLKFFRKNGQLTRVRCESRGQKEAILKILEKIVEQDSKKQEENEKDGSLQGQKSNDRIDINAQQVNRQGWQNQNQQSCAREVQNNNGAGQNNNDVQQLVV